MDRRTVKQTRGSGETGYRSSKRKKRSSLHSKAWAPLFLSFLPLMSQKQFDPCHVFKIFRSQIMDDIFT